MSLRRALCLLGVFVASVWGAAPACVDFGLLVTASANNVNLTDPTLSQTFPVSGTFNISARFCEPVAGDVVAKRVNTLLVAQHGVTYNKIYWDIPLQREMYSFVANATRVGFPTLIYDLLGHGQSDRPDPLVVVQPALDVAIAAQISTMARRGQVLPAKRSFKSVVFIGHSYGSAMTNGLIVQHPDAADAAILTGFTNQEGPVPANDLAALATFLPASQVDPVRFPNLDTGFLTNTDQQGRFKLFYSPNVSSFDPALLALDEATKDTISGGEGGLFQTVVSAAPEFRKPVLVVNGREDILECTLNEDQPDLLAGDCGTGATSVPALEKQFFPNSVFSSAVIENTGHSINWHFSAPVLYKEIFSFLTRNGF